MTPARFAESIRSLLRRRFIHCDVGARDGLCYRWRPLRSTLKTVAFEPEREEFEKLSAADGEEGVTLNCAVFSKDGNLRLNLTRARGCSSVYEPNLELLSLYPEAERFTIDKAVEVPCSRLDALRADGRLPDLDFIKIDVQGAELDVLKGGRALLRESLIGMELEMDFIPMYRGQALFAEVDAYLRGELGLRMQDLRKYYWKLKGSETLGAPRGQLVFADALYLRAVEDFVPWCGTLSREAAGDKIRGAAVIGAVYGCLDYAMTVLNSPGVERFIGAEERARLGDLLRSYGGGVNFYRSGGFSRLANGFYSLYRIFQSTERTWTAAEPALGSRRRWAWFE